MSPLAPELEALYRDTVLEHYRHPRHRTPLHEPDAAVLVHNPVCGDQVRVELRLREGRVADVAAISRGCSIAVAAGSVMTEWVQGRAPDEIRALHRRVAALIAGEPAGELPDALRAFERVAGLPSRHRCALLAWEALDQALAEACPAA